MGPKSADPSRPRLILAYLAALSTLTITSMPCRGADPVLVDTYSPTGWVSAVIVQGRRAFVACDDAGLHVLDIDDFGKGRLVGRLEGPLRVVPDQMGLQGNRLFFASSRRLWRVDVSDPGALETTGNAPWPGFGLVAMTPLRNHVLLLDPGWLVTAEFYSPNALRRLPTWLPGADFDTGDVTTQNDLVFAAGGRRLDIHDFSAPAAPRTLHRRLLPTNLISCLAVDGPLLCLGSDNRTVSLLDIHDPSNPIDGGSLQTAGGVYDVMMAGARVIVSEGSAGIEILDISDLQNPVVVGQVNTPGMANSVAVTGPFILVADGPTGLLVYQSDRTFPPKIAAHPRPGLAHPGGSHAFTVEAAGWDALSYQWLHDGVPIADGPRHDGAQTATLLVADIEEADAGDYHVLVSCLGETARSLPANLVVSRLQAWGRTRSSVLNLQAQPPDPLSVLAVEAGAFHGLALNADHTVFAWGKNADGQTNVPTGLTNVAGISAGSDHSLALVADGSVVAWGRDHHGQTQVPASATNVVGIAAGWAHSLALRADGTVVAWGNNEYGQCSVDVHATDVIAIAAGYYDSMALRVDGSVVAWGLDGPAPEWATNVVGIAMGWGHSLALRADGTVIAWGDDSHGQSSVPDSATNVVAVNAGFYHSLALRADGTVVSWGRDAFGMVTEAAGLQDVAQVDAGEDHSLALMAAATPLVSLAPAHVWGPSGGRVTFSATVRGRQPLSLQWFHGEDPVPGATNRILVLEDLSAEDDGYYHLDVVSADGPTQTVPTRLSVVDIPPSIEELPARRFAGENSAVELGARVRGSRPVHMQWLREGVPILDGTNAVLRLDPARVPDSATYTVQASNLVGAAEGGPTILTVFPITDPAELAAGADTSDLEWTTSPDSPWTLVLTGAQDGVDALLSGVVTDDLETWVQTTVTGPALVTWSGQVSGSSAMPPSPVPPVTRLELASRVEPLGDWREEARLGRTYGFVPMRTLSLDFGAHILRWTFSNAAGVPSEIDRAYLDEVRVEPLPALSAARGSSANLIEVKGLVGWTCSIEFTTSLAAGRAWDSLSSFELSTTTQTLELPPPEGSSQGYYRVRLLP